MAKNNLFLGTASRSVGDVTLMRRNGVQVSRVRVRQIANPRSEAQSRQRMAFAAVTRFYSPLSSCLEQSFQGLNRTDSLSAFLKENIKRAREMQFGSLRGGGFVPLPVMVSRGSMPQAVYNFNADDVCFQFELGTEITAMTVAAVSTALKNQYGLSEGDQVTIIYSMPDTQEVTVDSLFSVYYHRFFIDSSDFSTFSVPMLNVSIDGSSLAFSDGNDSVCGFAVIFSRYEAGQWRRSTQYMAVADYIEELFVGESAQDSFLPGWEASRTTPSSRVYLNGSGSTGANAVVRGWKLTGNHVLSGDPIVLTSARQVDFGDENPVKALQLSDADGNWYYVTSLNTRAVSYLKLCPGWSNENGSINPGNDFDWTSAITLCDSSNINLNGEHGRDAVQYLLSLGIETDAAISFGQITQ